MFTKNVKIFWNKKWQSKIGNNNPNNLLLPIGQCIAKFILTCKSQFAIKSLNWLLIDPNHSQPIGVLLWYGMEILPLYHMIFFILCTPIIYSIIELLTEHIRIVLVCVIVKENPFKRNRISFLLPFNTSTSTWY